MKPDVYLGIDHGNYKIKTKNESFFSNFYRSSSPPALNGQDIDCLEYDKGFYTINNSPRTVHVEKTEDDSFYVATLFAIAKELKARNLPTKSVRVNLGVGLPAGDISEGYVGRFQDYLRRKNPVKFKYNGTDYVIEIGGVAVFPQGFGTLYAEKRTEFLKDPELDDFILMDIGGGTTEIIRVYKDEKTGAMSLDPSQSRSLNRGMITLAEEIENRVKKEFTVVLDPESVIRVSKKYPRANDRYRNNPLNRRIYEVSQEVFREFTDVLVNSVSSYGTSLMITPLYLSGGGAILLRQYFEEREDISDMDSSRDPNANARGYEKFLADYAKSHAKA